VHLSDSWWREAQSSGLLDIGSHGWNHVHPLVSDMKGRPELVESFHRIESPDDVALQMDSSFEFIRRKAGGDSARIFAYPYGQVSEFIASEYFPRQANYLGACGTDPRPLRADSDPWRLPRYVCGWHWKGAEELGRLLAEG
jgi:peptidoglycan/xylan/chitin deacetylase (PgdA/CDA1 family)